MTLSLKIVIAGLSLSIGSGVFAQNTEQKIQRYFENNLDALNLSKKDVSDWTLKDVHQSKEFDVTYAYAHQRYQGVEIHNAIANFVITDENVLLTGNRFVSNLTSKINTTNALISETEAIEFAAAALNLSSSNFTITKGKNDHNESVYLAPDVSRTEIPVKLCFTLQGDQLRLAYDLSIKSKKDASWWSVRIDAENGSLINKNDWTTSCSFGENCSDQTHNHTSPKAEESVMMPMPPPPSTDQYNVFAIPVESPNHGSRSLEVGPYDATASPFGWHDDNGVAGEEYTITRGNNVYATEDTNDDDNPGYAPDGGANLDFDFPLNLNQAGTGYWDAAITNLFYMNNMMHDVWYHYGFDEPSGNFQQNNYGNGGAPSDYVNADAQDGSGTNNANFSTPPDGSNPRMQMYMWTNNGSPKILEVNTAGPVQGLYSGVGANFGPGIPATPVTADFVLYEDATPEITDGCEPAVNASELNGKIAVIRRGNCAFTEKVVNAQDAGAVGVIIVNNVGGVLNVMGGTDPSITIPSVMVTMLDGENIISEMQNGTINGSIGDFGPFGFDSDFDNGIIAHEYGHGISNRLTGGGSQAGCLYNEEQMGEGWSDWFSLMMTMEPGDAGTDARGIGTYASGESVNGGGIRPAPYSTDFSINNFTYGGTNNLSISQPHGIGFIWCTMLWDLTWALIDKYGFDPDIYNGTGGNNIAMHLIMNGMKMQPCSPGFVDGRDAILAADFTLYNGENECLIWEVFANRGLGYSADQGSSNDRQDQVQAFDLPPTIDHVTTETIYCQDYIWPVNGQTYSTSGTYYASITPNSTCDSIATLNLTVNNTINSIITYNGPSTLASTLNNVNYQWLSCSGGTYTEIPGATNQTYTPTQVGLYSVVATQGNCSDTSVCMFVNQINSINELDLGDQLTVYPNPTNGELFVNLGDNEFTEVNVRILNGLGQVILSKDYLNTDAINLSFEGAPGIYFVSVTADNKTGIVKVVRE